MTSSDATKATASVSGSTVTVTAKRTGSTNITVTASDGNLTASQIVPLTVQSRNNNQPVQKVGSIPAQRVDVGGSSKAVDVSGYFSDADGDLMAYSATSSDSTKAEVSTTGSTVTLTPVAGGTATITVTADDGQGSSTTQAITVTVNRAPTKHGSLAAQTVRVGTTPKGVDVSSGFDDPDNHTLTYTASSSDKTKATASVSGFNGEYYGSRGGFSDDNCDRQRWQLDCGSDIHRHCGSQRDADGGGVHISADGGGEHEPQDGRRERQLQRPERRSVDLHGELISD